jgi:hypothetical protein
MTYYQESKIRTRNKVVTWNKVAMKINLKIVEMFPDFITQITENFHKEIKSQTKITVLIVY